MNNMRKYLSKIYRRIKLIIYYYNFEQVYFCNNYMTIKRVPQGKEGFKNFSLLRIACVH